MKKNRILVVAAHPDDEVLGAGGTLLRLASEGDNLHIVFLSKGETSRGKKVADEKLRTVQAEKVAKIVRAEVHWPANLPDNEFDRVSLLRITKIVEELVHKLKPNVVYSHHGGDLNIDHRRTFQAVMTACRPGKTSVKRIYSFEVLSSTEWQAKTALNSFLPNVYVDIEKFIEDKINLLNIYQREIGGFPFPRSAKGIMTLAQYRGMESGLKFVEAFQLIRATE